MGADELADALAELRTLVYRLADEVAAFRRRALAAEGRQREAEELLAELRASASARERVGDVEPAEGEQLAATVEVLERRVEELEGENAELGRRLGEAAERTSRLLERTRFLRQQQEDAEGKG